MDFGEKSRYQMVNVSRLELGMYVAELDRPWAETPFKYEGFEILTVAEIEMLQTHCKVVYIDPAHVSSSITARARLLASESTARVVETQRDRLHDLLSDFDPYDYKKQKHNDAVKRTAEAFNHARAKLIVLLQALSRGRRVEAGHCRGVVEPLVKCILDDPDSVAWMTMINKADPEPNDRNISTAVWAAIFARYLRLAPPIVLDIASGGLLLDVGFSRLSASVREHEGVFEDRMRLAMRSHVKLGNEMLDRMIGITPRVRQMQREHHERIDGSGYPRRLSGDNVTHYGSFAGLVDSYDAMLSKTAYRPALSSAEAMSELNKMSGLQFPRLHVECFIQAMGTFPDGSIVELNTGEIAIVLSQDHDHRLRPEVLIVRDENKKPMDRPYKLNLGAVSARSGDQNAVWIAQGLTTGSHEVYPRDFFSKV